MTPDVADTIVAIATARGGSERGVVRVSGPYAVGLASELTGGAVECTGPRRFAEQSLLVEVDGSTRPVPCDLLVWPDERSYTRQPSVEFHTVGAPPVLDAIVRACLAAGARLAEPGEFTLRAFLAGRLDLTQAEAVLSVIDAADQSHLDAALERLAGGLSTPLHRLRAELLGLLADLEAGLDFVEEEDVRFVEPDELCRRLAEAAELVAQSERQLGGRDLAERLPRVAIIGPPNVGKSRLFNALVERYGDGASARALVADEAGVTRDTLAAAVSLEGVRVELVDTAGDDDSAPVSPIDAAARQRLGDELSSVELSLRCEPANRAGSISLDRAIGVATMADRYAARPAPGWVATSAETGEGVDELARAISDAIRQQKSDPRSLTADRCRSGLAQARGALARAEEAAASMAGEELVSLELREALDGLGRVVGEVVTDEVLGEVFGKFCIGK